MNATLRQSTISVLLLEDDHEDAMIVREFLAETPDDSFEPCHVNQLAGLGEALANSRFDCAVVDLSLPGAAELEALRRVRAGAPELAIVILTGLDDEQLAVKALHEGAQDYLIKGQIDGEMLARSIRYAIERKRAEIPKAQRTAGQHRTVTMLFTNLVGSTDLLERLGDEAAEKVRRTHFRVLREAVLARDGQEVKNLGDGLMVAFPSALDAVSCAIDMQRAVDRYNRDEADGGLQVRVGLHVGEPIRREDDYFGTPVVVAKRLCDAASGSQILASGLVRNLIGSRGGHDFRRSEALTLKGLGEPVTAHEVAWEPEMRAELALPAALASPRRTPFVGRNRELERLNEHWGQALQGEHRLVFLSGESGIGKTRMAEEFSHSVHKQGAIVLHGRSDEHALVPYQPLVEALGHYVAACSPAQLRQQMRGKERLQKLLPDIALRAPGLVSPAPPEPETERYLLFGSVASLLGAVSERAPVLLVLEDLHWADQPTLLLLRHIARHPFQSPLLVLGTYRETERVRGDLLSQTLVDLRRDRLFDRLDIEGLDEDSIRIMVSSWPIGEAGPELAHSLHSQTRGNPFFIEEILRDLSQSGAIENSDDSTFALSIEEIGIPNGIKEAIAHRLLRLSAAANRVLRISAVIGPEFDLEILGRASDLPEDRLLDALEEGFLAGLVEEMPGGIPRYSFSHALIRDTLYASLRKMERVRLHGTIGEALEQAYPDVPEHFTELARHYAEAPRGHAGKALRYATLAGRHAMLLSAYEQAAELFSLALAVSDSLDPDLERRAELTLLLGRAQTRGDDPAARETLIAAAHAARAVDRPKQLAEAALGIHALNSFPGVADREAIELLEDALEVIGTEEPGLRARLLVRLAVALYYLVGTAERREALVEEAVATARRVDDRETLAYVLGNGQLATWGPDTTKRDLDWVKELLEIAVEPASAELAFHTRMRQVDYLLELDDLGAADAAIEALERMATDSPDPRARAYVPLQLARRASIDGRYAEFELLNAEATRAAGVLGDRMLELLAAAQLAMLHWLQGRMDETEEVTRRFASDAPGMPAWHAGLLVMECELGRHAEASRELENLAERDFASVPRYNGWLLTMALLADACARLGDRKSAPKLYRQLLPFAERNVVTPYTIFAGPVSRYLGMLAATSGEWDAAASHFERANQAAERLNARPFAMLLALDEARMRLARGQSGDREHALAILDTAARRARELEASKILGQVEELRSRFEQDGRQSSGALVSSD